MKLFNSVISLFLFTFISACSIASDYPLLSQQQLLDDTAAGKSQLLLDVRTAEEFAEGHISQATNISHDEVPARINEIIKLSQERSIPVIVYCRSGRRADIVLEQLQAKGFTNIYHLEGDMNAWLKAKRPIVK